MGSNVKKWGVLTEHTPESGPLGQSHYGGNVERLAAIEGIYTDLL
jgi:hypothetical protein